MVSKHHQEETRSTQYGPYTLELLLDSDPNKASRISFFHEGQ